jgi:predicted aspartyl protease
MQMVSSLVVVPVAIENTGVYSFLLDTGTGTTVIDTGLADELRLTVSGRTTLMTTSGSRAANLARASFGFGGIRTESIDVLAAPLDAIRVVDRNIRGVLGQDILRRSNWRLDYRRGVIEQHLDGSDGGEGCRLSLQWSAGRPTIEGTFDLREPINLVLDSAATGLVLFAPEAARTRRESMRMRSLDADIEVPIVTAHTLRVGPMVFSRPRAGLVVRSDHEPGEGGLLPTSMFEAIYFDNMRDEVVLSPLHRESMCRC